MTTEEREDMNTFKHDLVKQVRWWQWKAETLEKENEQLKAENAVLRERLSRAVELPCNVGDTLYEPFIDMIREWEVESIYLKKNRFQANCVNKNDYKMHWNFIKADYCNEFEGKGRVRVTREAAEARLAELKGEKTE